MKIKIWTRITDNGDGSSSVQLYSSESDAREGLDDEGFDEFACVPCEISSMWFDSKDCETI